MDDDVTEYRVQGAGGIIQFLKLLLDVSIDFFKSSVDDIWE